MSVYSDASYLINCMRRGWYRKWRENGWLNYRNEAVANKDLWERLLEAAQRHQQVRWRKIKGTNRPQAHTSPATTGPTNSLWPPKTRQSDHQYRRHHDGRGCRSTQRNRSILAREGLVVFQGDVLNRLPGLPFRGAFGEDDDVVFPTRALLREYDPGV